MVSAPGTRFFTSLGSLGRGNCRQRIVFGGRRVDDFRDLEHAVGRKPAATRMLANELHGRRDVDARDLVFGHVALHPLDVGAKLAQNGARCLCDVFQVCCGERARVRDLALDEELRHCCSPDKSGGLQWASMDWMSVVLLQFTSGFQSAYSPLGLVFQAHTCSPHSWKVSFCLNFCPKRTGGASLRACAVYGMMYSTATSCFEPSACGSYSSSSGWST